MNDQRRVRRLAAIFAADIVGYSRLVEIDEEGTIDRRRSHLEKIFVPAVTGHGGRIFKTTGDGILVEFSSVVDAVDCAVDVQRQVALFEADEPRDRQIIYRIGINLGDIVVEDGDVMGDGVNVAARLEGMAAPGSVLVSGTVFDQLKQKLDFGYRFEGERQVKNIREPIRVYTVLPEGEPRLVGNRRARLGGGRRTWLLLGGAALALVAVALSWWQPWAGGVERSSESRMAFRLPKVPSIVVLPFDHLSANKDQEIFADGITEDIITDLSKISGIFVVAGNTSFTYKGKAVKLKKISEDLGVRYVLEGTLRRSGNRVRITARLTDVLKGRNLWSDRFDRELRDTFAIQSEISATVVKAMAVTLKANELDRLYQKHTTSIEAYDAFVRARRIVDPPGRRSIAIAQTLFRRAIELDPKFAGGYAGLSFSYSSKSRLRLGPAPEEDAKLSLQYARKAVEVDRNFYWSYIALAGAHLANKEPDAALEAAREALRLQPNGYEAKLFYGFYLSYAGQADLAVQQLEAAGRMNPIESVRGVAFLANAYFMNGQYEKSETLRLRRIRLFPVRNPNPYIWLAATQFYLGKKAEAAATAEKFKKLRPGFRLSKWRFFDYFKLPRDRKRLLDGAIGAGIPE